MNSAWEPRLPSCPLRGRVLITEAALRGCEDLLPTYRGLDGDHEGIVFLCGRELADTQLLTDVYNDIAAVRLFPWVLRLAEGPDQYLRAGLANRLDPNVDFAENLTDDSDGAAPHHKDAAGRELSNAGRAWDLLAASSALRDRWYWPALRSLSSGTS